MKKEIEFNKYKKRGDYHWQGITGNIFNANIFLQARYQTVLNQIPRKNKHIVVADIGCGDGVLSYLIRKKSLARVFGVDPSLEAIMIARNKLRQLKIKDCSFKVGSGYELPFKNNYFDYVVLADVIEHVREPKKLLDETYRILKRNGIIILSSVIRQEGKVGDHLHTREYTSLELIKLLEKNYIVIKIVMFSPNWFTELYKISIPFFGWKPQPYRYFMNLIHALFKVNIFMLKFGEKFTCQTLIGKKYEK